jgi:magnesium transporter
MAMDEALVKATANDIEATGKPEILQKSWYYAIMKPGGAIVKGETDSPAAIPELLAGAEVGWVDYVAREAFDRETFDKQALNVAKLLGFTEQLVASFSGQSYLNYEDLDVEMGMNVPSVQVAGLDVQAYPLLLLLRKNFIFTIHPVVVDRRFIRLRRYGEIILKRIPVEAAAEDKLTLLLMRIVDHNNDRNFEHLRRIEEKGDELNEMMTDPYTPRAKLGPEIYKLKHALINYLNALWDSVDVLHTVRYGDAELITNDPLLMGKLSGLVEDVNRQIGLAEHMSEVLASGLEVLQSIYNNQLQALNNRLATLMTYLTIIGTAVLIPNTIATMLGNGVFTLGPQDLWWYWILMIGATALGTFTCYWWIRRKGWIPKKQD